MSQLRDPKSGNPRKIQGPKKEKRKKGQGKKEINARSMPLAETSQKLRTLGNLLLATAPANNHRPSSELGPPNQASEAMGSAVALL